MQARRPLKVQWFLNYQSTSNAIVQLYCNCCIVAVRHGKPPMHHPLFTIEAVGPRGGNLGKAGSLNLNAVLEALSDPTRRDIVHRLMREDFCCSSFCDLGSKTRLTYHFARLERAGLVQRQKNGRRVILSLDRRSINKAFPGLLRAIMKAEDGAGETA